LTVGASARHAADLAALAASGQGEAIQLAQMLRTNGVDIGCCRRSRSPTSYWRCGDRDCIDVPPTEGIGGRQTWVAGRSHADAIRPDQESLRKLRDVEAG